VPPTRPVRAVVIFGNAVFVALTMISDRIKSVFDPGAADPFVGVQVCCCHGRRNAGFSFLGEGQRCLTCTCSGVAILTRDADGMCTPRWFADAKILCVVSATVPRRCEEASLRRPEQLGRSRMEAAGAESNGAIAARALGPRAGRNPGRVHALTLRRCTRN
jgi:hypothetical protein